MQIIAISYFSIANFSFVNHKFLGVVSIGHGRENRRHIKKSCQKNA